MTEAKCPTHLRGATMSELATIATYSVFVASYVVFALGKFPGMKIDRPGAAIIGAVLMFMTGAVRVENSLRLIHFGTIVLLFSMMLVVAYLHLAGFFDWITELVVTRLKPHHLLPTVIFLSGLLSAFFVNDIIMYCHGSFRVESHPPNGSQTNTLSLSGGNGVKHRKHRNHHGKPAEYLDRVFFRHWVSGFPAALGSCCARGFVPQLARTLVVLLPWTYPRCPNRSSRRCGAD